MTKKFTGFPPGKVKMTAVPGQFFSEVVPMVNSLSELKVILFALWALQQKEGKYRYLRFEDFINDQSLGRGLAQIESDEPLETILTNAIEQAVEDGVLLQAKLESEHGNETIYFANTVNGRVAVEQIVLGNWQPGSDDNLIEILPERPNIYGLYEANIGALTPLIAEEIQDAAEEFPEIWIHEAIRQAVENNVRRWKYIRAILERWKQEGRSHEINEGDSLADGQRFISGKYADFIES